MTAAKGRKSTLDLSNREHTLVGMELVPEP